MEILIIIKNLWIDILWNLFNKNFIETTCFKIFIRKNFTRWLKKSKLVLFSNIYNSLYINIECSMILYRIKNIDVIKNKYYSIILLYSTEL